MADCRDRRQGQLRGHPLRPALGGRRRPRRRARHASPAPRSSRSARPATMRWPCCTLDPARVVVVDLSAAQIECLKVRIAAYPRARPRGLPRADGIAPVRSPRRAARSRRVATLPADRRRSGRPRARRRHRATASAASASSSATSASSSATCCRWCTAARPFEAAFVSAPAGRARAVRARRAGTTGAGALLLQVFFSRFTMGRLGRDPAFFDHVEGSVADHVARRIVHAGVELDPADNPYLHWILTGTHGDALPLAWRAEHFETIRARLDRLDIRHGALEAFVVDRREGRRLQPLGYFRIHDAATRSRRSTAGILDAANPGARLVYWNMMAPRRVAAGLRGTRAPAGRGGGARQGRRQGVLLFRLRGRGGLGVSVLGAARPDRRVDRAAARRDGGGALGRARAMPGRPSCSASASMSPSGSTR